MECIKKCQQGELYKTNARLMFFPKNSSLWGIRLVRDRLSDRLLSTNKADVNKILARVIRSMGNTVFFNLSKRLTQSKGEIRLAEILDSGDSLELEYFADLRGEKEVYRLKTVIYVKRSGRETVLTRAPLGDDGKSIFEGDLLLTKTPIGGEENVSINSVSDKKLQKNIELLISEQKLPTEAWYASKEARHLIVEGYPESIFNKVGRLRPYLAPENQEAIRNLYTQIIECPVLPVLKGPVVAELMKWTPILAYLGREEIRNFPDDARAIRTLYLRAKIPHHWAFMKAIIKKQSFKWTLFAALILGYSYSAGFFSGPQTSRVYLENGETRVDIYDTEEAKALESLYAYAFGDRALFHEKDFETMLNALQRQKSLKLIYSDPSVEEYLNSKYALELAKDHPDIQAVELKRVADTVEGTAPIWIETLEGVFKNKETMQMVYFGETKNIVLLIPDSMKLRHLILAINKSKNPELFKVIKGRLFSNDM